MIPIEPGAAEVPGSWRFVGFRTFGIRAGESWRCDLGDREACVVALAGTCVVRTSAGDLRIGERADPFGGAPGAAYVPAGTDLAIEATSLVDLAIGLAPGAHGAAARRLGSPRREIRGSGAMERTIHHILMEDQPASSLLVTEVVTPAGHWSSYPPHKHDTDDPPNESYLEEIYYFRFRQPGGFGLMRVYTKDGSLDEAIAVRDRDLVLVPRGYHTFSAAPGYDAYYLNVMAGPRREWKITFDPDHDRMRW
jgi:5-deoxy-glucuronate isomerase